MKPLYDSPRTLFQDKVNSLLKAEEANSEVFETIFKLTQVLQSKKVSGDINNQQWKMLLQLYEELGSKNFVKIIQIMGGNTITFPTKEETEDAITTAVSYYYREIEGKSWEDIRELLGSTPVTNNPISLSLKVRNLKSFIDTNTFAKLNKKEQ